MPMGGLLSLPEMRGKHLINADAQESSSFFCKLVQEQSLGHSTHG
jgi:hypothetical protein